MLKSKDMCCGCGACAAICKANAINMYKDSEGFCYPDIDISACRKCKRCEAVCPILNIDKIKSNTHNLKTFAGYLENNDDLLKSASGGVFIAIANKVLQEKGYICGVIYSDDFKSAYHVCTNELSVVEKMRGSKYIQSDLNSSTYTEIFYLLESGTPVFFTGTPCEVMALRSYLKKDYKQLYTCDLICHGVTTQIAQKEYVEYLENKYSSKIKELSTRHKAKDEKNQWSSFNFRAVFENGRIFSKPFFSTPFGFAFNNIALRSSCYCCKFKGDNRASDITIGDFWGIDNDYEYFNELGTSAIIINTQKGAQIVNDLKKFRLFESDYTTAANGNPRLLESIILRTDRKRFFDMLNSKGLIYADRKLNESRAFKVYFRAYLSKITPYYVKKVLKRISTNI